MKRVLTCRVSLCFEFRAPKTVKVKAYKRVRRGKLERVRSYYRTLRDVR